MEIREQGKTEFKADRLFVFLAFLPFTPYHLMALMAFLIP